MSLGNKFDEMCRRARRCSVCSDIYIFTAALWWKLRRGRPIGSLSACAIWFLAVDGVRGWGWKDSESVRWLTDYSDTPTRSSPSGTGGGRALFLFNPHYSQGADSIWWVSEPCSEHGLHSPPATYLPSVSSLWLQLLFFFFFPSLRAQGSQIVRSPRLL